MPASVPQRGGNAARVAALVEAAGLYPIAIEAARPGDLLLLAVGMRQLHLAVLTEAGVVHADAGLRRVVERTGAPPWPIVAAWRAG